jgi:hypothetical protein
MGLTACEWAASRMAVIRQELGLTCLAHTHHAGEDAQELATVFADVLRRQREISGMKRAP